jgi:hypothetical protein
MIESYRVLFLWTGVLARQKIVWPHLPKAASDLFLPEAFGGQTSAAIQGFSGDPYLQEQSENPALSPVALSD